MTHPPAAASPAWVLTAVAYDSPDARRLTQALHREQLATYGFADDPADTPPGSSTIRTARSSWRLPPEVLPSPAAGGAPRGLAPPSSSACTSSRLPAARGWPAT
jgi:hypothetical protein